MSNIFRHGAVALVAAIVLAGCGKTPEDRINAAIPVAKDVAESETALTSLLAAAGDDGKTFAPEYRDRLRIRAIECSHGFEPSWWSSEQAIRDRLASPDCFVQADRKLREWLDRRRVSLLLALPALRPATGMAGMLVADDRIQNAAFAAKAGVAVLQWGIHYRLFDLASGAVIHDGELSLQGQLSLSDNGRILVNGTGSGAEVRDAETGALLATLPEPRAGQLYWLGHQGAVLAGVTDGSLTYFDLATGERQRLPFATPLFQGAWPLGGVADTYALVGYDRVASLQLAAKPEGWQASILTESRLPQTFNSSRTDLVAGADGRRIVAAGNALLVFRPDKLAPDTVSFAPLRVLRALPDASAGQWLVQVIGAGLGGASWYRYEAAGQRLAKLDTSQWLSSRLVVVPSLSRLAMIDGSKLVPAPELEAGSPRLLSELIDDAEFEAQLAKIEAADRAPRPFATRAPLPTSDSGFAQTSPRPVPAGREGLVEALRQGVIRTGDASDLNEWIRRYESHSGRSLGREFEERLSHQNIYVITGDFTVPSGLTGANSAIFVLERRAPFPHGDLGHAVLLDTNNGTCSGSACMIYVGR